MLVGVGSGVAVGGSTTSGVGVSVGGSGIGVSVGAVVGDSVGVAVGGSEVGVSVGGDWNSPETAARSVRHKSAARSRLITIQGLMRSTARSFAAQQGSQFQIIHQSRNQSFRCLCEQRRVL